MPNPTLTLPALGACAVMLAACAADQPDLADADIAKVSGIEEAFGAPFTVNTVGPAAVDPRLLGPQNLPEGLTFDPPDCGKVANEQALPPDVKGNMAAVTAEGEGIRYIVIAVETSEPVPVNSPGEQCQKVTFTGPGIRGLVEVIESPQIEDTHTVGTHRVLQTTTQDGPRTGELYNYVANFGNFIVIVTANPMVVPDRPVARVDTERARELVTRAVELVKG